MKYLIILYVCLYIQSQYNINMKNIKDFDTNNHSVYMLNYHLIVCIKKRCKVIDCKVSNRLKEIFLYIAPSYNIILKEWNYDMDYIHVLVKCAPNTEMSKFINAYKSASSRLIKKEYPEIKAKLWNEMFWSQSFCLISTGEATIEVVNQYIQMQGDKENKEK